MKLENRRHHLNQELKSHVRSLLETSFIRELTAGTLDPKTVWSVFSQYRHYCMGFTGFLEALLKRTNSPVAQKPLLENLWEERGSGDANLAHVTMLGDFVEAWGEALGMKSDEARALPVAQLPVSSFLGDIRQYLQTAPIPSAFGFIGPGTEEVTSEQYARLLKGLRSYGLVPDSKLSFFEVHIAADIQHANLFWEALEHVASSEAEWNQVTDGAKHSLSRETKFWNEMMGIK